MQYWPGALSWQQTARAEQVPPLDVLSSPVQLQADDLPVLRLQCLYHKMANSHYLTHCQCGLRAHKISRTMSDLK